MGHIDEKQKGAYGLENVPYIAFFLFDIIGKYSCFGC